MLSSFPPGWCPRTAVMQSWLCLYSWKLLSFRFPHLTGTSSCVLTYNVILWKPQHFKDRDLYIDPLLFCYSAGSEITIICFYCVRVVEKKTDTSALSDSLKWMQLLKVYVRDVADNCRHDLYSTAESAVCFHQIPSGYSISQRLHYYWCIIVSSVAWFLMTIIVLGICKFINVVFNQTG